MGEHLLISGEFGFGNTGDEAILGGLLAGLRARHPRARYTVVSGAPERTRSLHGVEAVAFNEPAQILVAARAADLLIVGGGGVFVEREEARAEALLTPLHRGVVFAATLPILARALGKRCVILAAGVGPLRSEDARALTRLAFESADRASVRDADSLGALAELRAEKSRSAPVEVTADLAFALTTLPARERVRALLDSAGVRAGRPLVVVALRPLPHGARGWETHVAEGLAELRAATGAALLFLPLQREGESNADDVGIARAVAEAIAARAGTQEGLHVLETPLDVDMTRGVIAAADAVLAERHHAALFALAEGIAPVALACEAKLVTLMRRAHLEASCLALENFTAPQLTAALRRALETRAANRTRLLGFADEMRAFAARNLELVDLALAQPAAPADPALRVLVEQNLHRYSSLGRLQSELDAAEKRISTLERQLESITSSQTFKVARRLRDLSVRAAPQATRRRGAVSTGVGWVREVRRLGTRGLAKKYLPRAVQGPILRAYHGARGLKANEVRSADRRALTELLREHPNAVDVFVLAPSIPWDVALFQRPQQLAMALARLGVLVIYVEPGRRDAQREHGFVRHSERLYLAQVDREVFDVLEDYTLYVLSWNKAWTERLRPRRVLYDFIDDLDVFNVPDRAQLEADHRTLAAEATVVSATAALLFREVQALRPDAILCPNGVDHAHFVTARDRTRPPPSDIADIVAIGKPVVGYYGALARWFDYELLWAVAARRPDLSFLLIGPDYDKTLRDQSLFRLPNVRWIGPRHYSILPNYLAAFDVATVPFKVNAITNATSPLKLFEYMAGGKVVVTTPMAESMRYENVLVGGDPETFSKRLSEALELRKDPAFMALNDRIALENTWDARASQLLGALGKLPSR